jgi:hypothetical protein
VATPRDPRALDVPAVCEQWLASHDRVAWLQQRLGNGPPMQEIGQVFCHVIWAWGRELEEQGVGMPEQQAVIVGAGFAGWAEAMQKYPWERPAE